MNELEAPTPDSKRGTHLLAILVLCYTVSFAGAEGIMRGLGDWYPALEKPAWALPMALFVPLWTLLYGVVALSVWLIWESSDRPARLRSAAIAFVVPQLILGGAWPWLFFAYRAMLLSAIEGALVWMLTGVSILAFARVRVWAALLLIPYWVWAAYLSILAFVLYRAAR